MSPTGRESPTLALARELLRRASVTPDDAGCQALLGARLSQAGFAVESLRYGEVDNLWARRGSVAPLFVFAGHTDVVPTGPVEQWSHPPFAAEVHDGVLHGRGAADMKGSIAAMVVACEQFLRHCPQHAGSIGFLITSDEEGPARDGTRRVVEALQRRGESIDWCLVGEPSSEERLGDVAKNGRRGSLGGSLLVRGRQGHVAYPQHARNPVHEAAAAIEQLVALRWDEGNAHFPPTSFQISNVHAGTGAVNVIPGELRLEFNLRFSTASDPESIKSRIQGVLDAAGLDYELRWHLSGLPFITEGGRLIDATLQATAEIIGSPARLSTAGGTSDGRFIAPTGAQVIELGPLNRTIHQVDEQVAVEDLETLTRIYRRLLEGLLGEG